MKILSIIAFIVSVLSFANSNKQDTIIMLLAAIYLLML